LKRVLAGLLAVALAGCSTPNLAGTGAASTPTTSPTPPSLGASASPRGVAPSCAATDQDQYVYNPDRLRVQSSCIRVTGAVAAIRTEADGDLHILLALDPTYADLLMPANQGVELGDLVVEPVCVRAVTQADAVASCAADPDPLTSLPVVGLHVWMEGRYVFDEDHGGWAELHPLFRWGLVSTATPAPTPPPPATAAATPTPRPTTALSVRITSITSPIAPGSYATVKALTVGSASCSITVIYKSGPSKAAGLGPKTASSTGAVSWTWKVGTRTAPGSWPVTVSCSRSGQSASATVYLSVI
jgi:hypothetical protein